ncbi:hypothetical protein [Mycolicibacterium rutilum]|uniref:hypothetical protein n=1 Tax=Mycolicibacterium rutilum TaxID=370526 RepID=UPI0012FFAA65|nr:hypothetical protein [Mycolicibacterium rutilum]
MPLAGSASRYWCTTLRPATLITAASASESAVVIDGDTLGAWHDRNRVVASSITERTSGPLHPTAPRQCSTWLRRCQ